MVVGERVEDGLRERREEVGEVERGSQDESKIRKEESFSRLKGGQAETGASRSVDMKANWNRSKKI